MCDSPQGSLCPSPMKIHQKYVDTVTLFSKTWTKSHWPLDDLWPHICSGHMCASTQGPLCPSPMGIHQCMWIQWSILQNTTYIRTRTRFIRTYILRTEWVITKSLSEQSSGKTKTTWLINFKINQFFIQFQIEHAISTLFLVTLTRNKNKW